MNLTKIIGIETHFSNEFMDAFTSISHLKNYPKGKILLREGAICRHLYFIQKGCLRFYYNDEEGKDITHWFSFEGDFMTEVNSFYSQAPSDFYLETLEDSQILTLSLANIERLSNNFPEYNKMERMIYRKALLELGEKIKDLQFRDAKTRYDNLIKKQEDILMRVPLGHIASYLGITQQSLSRIRRLK